MRILKSETARFIAIGFVAGTALMLAIMGLDSGTSIAEGVVPVAHAGAAN